MQALASLIKSLINSIFSCNRCSTQKFKIQLSTCPPSGFSWQEEIVCLERTHTLKHTCMLTQLVLQCNNHQLTQQFMYNFQLFILRDFGPSPLNSTSLLDTFIHFSRSQCQMISKDCLDCSGFLSERDHSLGRESLNDLSWILQQLQQALKDL